jgi:5-methylcytosine-specific restriction endonuclease McrA
MADYWSKLYCNILDDPEMGILSDKEWRHRVENIIRNPNNIFCDPKRDRYSWNLCRRKRRKEVFARDKHVCKKCNSIEDLQVDHIIPLAKGGSNDLDNLQILCRKCNREKWVYT